MNHQETIHIDRGDTTVVNPGPDEELQIGDTVLVSGSTAQRDGDTTMPASR